MAPLGSPPRLLVTDDEAGFRELCVDLLADSGYTVESAADGKTALDLLEERDFQLVLSDLNMPVLDGLTLLKRVKARRPDTEVILMTAFGGLQSALDALRLGAYDYITKPFTRETLLATVRRCLEKQRLAGELKHVQAQLIEKEKLAALGSVSGWLAHRMRNPLNVIQMCAQYLKARFDASDERREVAQAIEDKVNVLEHMTHDFIRFSRDYQPRLREEDLRDLINGAMERVRSQNALQEVRMEKKYEEPIPLVPMDKDLMEEVLGYLLNNAAESLEGPGTIDIRAGKETNGVYIEIANSGPEIPESIRRRMFEPFFTTKERGTGLGLAIARRVIESHGGEITLRPGTPTAFHIHLPASAGA